MIEWVSLMLSIIALVTSVSFAVRQLMISRHTNMLPVLINVYQEYRSMEFKQHFYYVITKLKDEHDPTKTGFRFLPEPAAAHVRITSHFFDNLGVLIVSGAVEEQYIISFVGDSIDRAWSVLEPYIMKEREFLNGDYQEFFEHLVVRVRENPPFHVRRTMNLQKLR
jgi:hypothetical protein